MYQCLIKKYRKGCTFSVGYNSHLLSLVKYMNIIKVV